MDIENLTLADRIQLGAKFLDDVRPGWAGQIDLKTLDLANPASCVLGQTFSIAPDQAYSPWTTGSLAVHDWLVEHDYFDDEEIDNAAVLGGFDREGQWEDYYLDLQTAWVEVIEARR